MTMGGSTEKGKYVTVWTRTGRHRRLDGRPRTSSTRTRRAGRAARDGRAQHDQVGRLAALTAPGREVRGHLGDPSQAGPFVIRAQVPAGYRVPPHWHPTAENLTVLSGTVALGMGEKWDDAALSNLAVGGFCESAGGHASFLPGAYRRDVPGARHRPVRRQLRERRRRSAEQEVGAAGGTEPFSTDRAQKGTEHDVRPRCALSPFRVDLWKRALSPTSTGCVDRSARCLRSRVWRRDRCRRRRRRRPLRLRARATCR